MSRKETIRKGWSSIVAPLVVATTFLVLFYVNGFSTEITKQISYRHGVSENGNLQTFQVITVLKDGVAVSEKIGHPYTPKDYANMEGYDQRSKDIVDVIISPEILTDFETEKNGVEIDGEIYKHPEKMTGEGSEDFYSWDRTIDNLGRINIRQILRCFTDGVEISKTYHRSRIMPGDSTIGKDIMSKAVAEKLHTAEVISAYEEVKAARTAK